MPVLYNTQNATDVPSLSISDIANVLRSAGQQRLAGALENIENSFNTLSQYVAAAPEGRFDDLVVTSADDGSTIAHIGSFPAGDHFLSGIATQNLWVGGNPDDPVNTAPFFTNGSQVFIGQNGQIFILDLDGNVKGFLGVQELSPINVTGAANNGTGLIRLTVVAHGRESGDSVKVTNVGGVPNATGSWPVTVIDANHLDLIGSTWAGSYTSGGTATPYYAGLHTETGAFGGAGFPDSLIRAYADGHLRIGHTGGPRLEVAADGKVTLIDAGITIHSGSVTITINDIDFIKVADPTFTRFTQMRPTQFRIESTANPARITTLQLDGLFATDNAGRNLTVLPSAIQLDGTVDATGYAVSGTSGISTTIVYVASVTVGTSSITYATPGGGSATTTVVTSVTPFLASRTFTNGIITA